MEKGFLRRKLDNSAKIFPISSGKKYSTVFRLTAVLKEEINMKSLKKAVQIALKRYPAFRMKMKYGFFWYYFEYNEKEPVIKEDVGYPCKYIEPTENNEYLFKVTYKQNSINLDTFHALADGNSASIFFREIIYSYLELQHKEEITKEIRKTRKVEEMTTEDSYINNYDKKAKSNASMKKAYILKGRRNKQGAVYQRYEIINFEQLKEKCKESGATVTQYLSAALIYAMYKGNYMKGKISHNKPIKLCIPVDLRKYYKSKTMSNFFSYITIEAYMKKLDNFDKILEFVKEEFRRKLTKNELSKTMSTNVKIGENPIIKSTPLFLKKIIVPIGYREIRKYTTMTYSNIGRVGIIGKYQKYIDYFSMLIAPEQVEKIKCASCTLGNKLVFSFSSNIEEVGIETTFNKFLKSKGIEVITKGTRNETN